MLLTPSTITLLLQLKLKNESNSTIIVHPTSKEEIADIIYSLNSNKASGPNSIAYRILFFLKNEISMQLVDLFNSSFVTCIFPSVLKTANVLPVFKNNSKLDSSNYHPVSLLLNTEKIVEKRMYNRLYIFLNNNNIIYSLQSGFRQHYSTSHTLINITEIIRKALHQGNSRCAVSVDLQKVLDAVDHMGSIWNLRSFQ